MSEKRLVKGERKFCGVCSGIANYLNVDVTIIRIATIILACAWGAGLLAYFVAAIVMPNE